MSDKSIIISGSTIPGHEEGPGSDPTTQFIGCGVQFKKRLSQIEKLGRQKTDDQFDLVIGRVQQILTNIDININPILVLENVKVNNVSVPDGYIVESDYISDLKVIASQDEEIVFEDLDDNDDVNSNDFNSKISMLTALHGSKSESNQNHKQLENNRKTPSHEEDTRKPQSPKVIYSASSFEEFVINCQNKNVTPRQRTIQQHEFQKLSTSTNPYSLLMEIPTTADSDMRNDHIDSTGSSSFSRFGHQSAFKCVQPKYVKNNMNILSPNQIQRSTQGFSQMSTDEIKSAGDFNFEENNKQFEKLPVEHKDKEDSYAFDVHRKPKGINSSKNSIEACKVSEAESSKNSNEHKTLKNERKVESIKISLESNKGQEGYNFITNQGIVIPTVNFDCRKAILNASHFAGLSYEKLVESMGRAISQITIQLSCEAIRLLPERPDLDRPKILIAANYKSHWQANSSLCAARILSSLGVKTFVILYQVDSLLCDDTSYARVEKEENLYKLTGNLVYISEDELMTDLKQTSDPDQNLSFDLFINGTNTLAPDLFSNFSISSLNQIIIDYDGSKSKLDESSDNLTTNARTYLVSSCLPLDIHFDILRNSSNSHRNESIEAGKFCKYFLVNLGIPQMIYENNGIIYKSPFSDRLFIQAFLPKKTK